MQPRSQSLICVFKKKHCAPPYLESFARSKDAICYRETHDKALFYARSPLDEDKEIHEVTIVPRTPSKQITEPIMLFCKISISLVI